jgi:hypothetical protein
MSRSGSERDGAVKAARERGGFGMAYSVILGIVIVALVVAGVIGSFWSAGSPLVMRRRHGRGDGTG